MKNINLKKAVYIVPTTIIGALSTFIIYGLLSIKFFEALNRAGLPIEYMDNVGLIYSPFPVYLFWLFILAGAVGGFLLGLRWWRIVYIEHRHWKNWRNICR